MAKAKLDARARHLLATRRGDAESGAEVGVLVQGVEPFAEDQLEALRHDGAELRSVAGDVLSANVSLDRLEAITDHDFVKRVEVSAPLYPEEGGPPPFLGDV
jgi:hypothetical protein